jgi:hypothetical protein
MDRKIKRRLFLKRLESELRNSVHPKHYGAALRRSTTMLSTYIELERK